MDTSTPTSARRAAPDTSRPKFTRGQTVVLPGGILGTVVESAPARRIVRANTAIGIRVGWHGEDSVQTRAEWLRAAIQTLRAVAYDIGHTPLEAAVNELEEPLRVAAEVADVHDATRGL